MDLCEVWTWFFNTEGEREWTKYLQTAENQSTEQDMELKTSDTTILMVNDDCLLYIFSYLGIRDVYSMENVCKRFQELSHMIYPTFRSLDYGRLCFDRVPIPELMNITTRVGQYIHTIDARSCEITMIRNAIPIFTRTSSYDEQPVNPRQYITIDEDFAFRSLKSAKLSCCNVTDDILNTLLPMEQIEKLNVSWANIKGTCFENLRNIRELDLFSCRNLDLKLFRQFCAATPNLLRLNIAFIPNIDYSSIQAIATHLTHLEELIISNYYEVQDMNILADMPKIKFLKLEYHRGDSGTRTMHEFLLRISHHNRLETLDYMDAAIDHRVEAAITNMTNLKILQMNLSAYFKDNTLDLITEIHKLEELHINNTFVTSYGLARLINRCPSIRLIDVHSAYYLERFLLRKIRDCLPTRSTVLEMRVSGTPLEEEREECEKFMKRDVFSNLKLNFTSSWKLDSRGSRALY